MNEQLKKAIQYTKDNLNNYQTRYRLNYHLMAPIGWINDPNGMSVFNGEYQAFYQHYPYDKEWGPMHWGHSKSKDMVHWEHLPIAIAPGDVSDAGGCYSGSAVQDGDDLVLIYTGHIFNDPNNNDPFSPDFTQNQNIAFSKDGVTFEKYANNPVIPAPPADNTQNFRDPKVWKHEDHWYMVVGSTSTDNIGRTILYKSKDLKTWDYVGVLATSDGFLGTMWECPDFFELDGKAVQLFSPVGMTPEGDKYHNVFQTGSIIGDYDYSTNTFNHGEFVEMDRGHDFYAVQTLETPDGRRVGFGWMNMWQTEMPEQEDNWCGAFTLPRELHVTSEGKLQMTPIKELESLRIGTLAETNLEVADGDTLFKTDNNAFEFVLKADVSDANLESFGFALDIGNEADVKFYYDKKAGKLVLDRGGKDAIRQCAVNELTELNLQVYVDQSSVEIFVNNGLETFTSRIYPKQAIKVKGISQGAPVSIDLVAYKLDKVID